MMTEHLRKPTLVLALASATGARHAHWLKALHDTCSICEVSDQEALELVIANMSPEVLIVDLALPGLGRVRGVDKIRHASPTTSIIALTDNPNDDEALQVLRAGARGYCSSAITASGLRKALTHVLDGEIWASRLLMSRLTIQLLGLCERLLHEGADQASDARLDALTARQRVVASLIGAGASNKEIGNRLHISERTVKAHLTETFRTVGVSDRLKLALLFQKRALTTVNGA